MKSLTTKYYPYASQKIPCRNAIKYKQTCFASAPTTYDGYGVHHCDGSDAGSNSDGDNDGDDIRSNVSTVVKHGIDIDYLIPLRTRTFASRSQ